VLDSSAIFSGHLPAETCFITPLIEMEIRDFRSKELLASHISSGKVMIRAPGERYLEDVRKKVLDTGDMLSNADMSVIALAIELDAVLVSDDYGVQNLASSLGLDVVSARTDGIANRFSWAWKCAGCGKRYRSGDKKTCNVCGSPLKRYVRGRTDRT